MAELFPRTEVGGISLPRMLAGTNWMLGYSHTGPAADEMIKNRHGDPRNVAAVLDAYMEYGIDAIMGPAFDSDSALRKGMFLTEEKFGKKGKHECDGSAVERELEDIDEQKVCIGRSLRQKRNYTV